REKIKNIKDVLTAKERTKAGATAPPQGLCLLKVKY
ncbi:MAG: tRNA pseudouridine(38-40) synthase TruA, partial [Candidatus Omnitrophica bacterium]|nr:tRNA pseudouridine(38-40) synthase TruA [Candidatus Omnitrophota bacterium]